LQKQKLCKRKAEKPSPSERKGNKKTVFWVQKLKQGGTKFFVQKEELCPRRTKLPLFFRMEKLRNFSVRKNKGSQRYQGDKGL